MRTLTMTEREFAWLRALMAAFSANSEVGDCSEQVENAASIDKKLRALDRSTGKESDKNPYAERPKCRALPCDCELSHDMLRRHIPGPSACASIGTGKDCDGCKSGLTHKCRNRPTPSPEKL